MSELKINPQIEPSWLEVLKNEFEKDYFKSIKEQLIEDKKKYTIYPPGSLIFQAFNQTPFDKTKIVILGQDPYHGYGQAHGMCFSVQKGVAIPPSLKNIYQELKKDLGIEPPNHGHLMSWAKEGVFLLNAFLTVRAKSPASHRKIGWEKFTDQVIKSLSDHRENLVFILWGNFAKQKQEFINTDKHCVITSPHPSPFSANNGFFGSKPFSRANEYLQSNGIEPVNWEIE
ncbi:MAG: uracil-DNA glycosylase [Salibacter sp.]|uniref:uracil-DNA glycosylase n=1 Tax=Salibacter sp. TaxID=2010995 RepID=UPI00286FFA39|nr:uracil-DNA glycosylase [Salibacter sp.]MDR9397509.1 uracil-DNA glycosylase [Salibacter sp.]